MDQSPRSVMDRVVAASLKHFCLPVPRLPDGFYATRSGYIVRACPPRWARGPRTKSVKDARVRIRNSRYRPWWKILKSRPHHKTGHQLVNVYVHGKARTFQVHTLIAETHLPPPADGCPLVAHRDGYPSHNWATNLRWKSHKANAADREFHRGGLFRGQVRPEPSDGDDLGYPAHWYEPDAAVGF